MMSAQSEARANIRLVASIQADHQYQYISLSGPLMIQHQDCAAQYQHVDTEHTVRGPGCGLCMASLVTTQINPLAPSLDSWSDSCAVHKSMVPEQGLARSL